jgi:Rifampin ADP-ribosyl transferase
MTASDNLNPKQFFHGTNVRHEIGGTIDPSQPHDQVHRASFPNSAYFTEHADEAHAYAHMAAKKKGGTPSVYQVEPTGDYNLDMTQRQGGSYTTRAPLNVVMDRSSDSRGGQS